MLYVSIDIKKMRVENEIKLHTKSGSGFRPENAIFEYLKEVNENLMAKITLALCICTIDRPDVLARCLAAIGAGARQPDQIIVSDDSKDTAETKLVCNGMINVTYIEGPRRGLCANRNFVIRHAHTDYLSLLDDDAMVSIDFVSRAIELTSSLAEKSILTGLVEEDGKDVMPFNPSFWGHFTKPPVRIFKNINLNCNIFPRIAFECAEFDEAISYGYEDTDLCAALLAQGFKIEFVPVLRNVHAPPRRSQAKLLSNLRRAERARFYTTIKRYLIWEECYFCLLLFVVLAPIHRAVHAAKRQNWSDFGYAFQDMTSEFISAAQVKKKSLRLLSDRKSVV